MMRKSVPDRWLDYSNIGKPIPGTKFIAFKVPLKSSICNNLPIDKRFTTDMLIESVPNIKLIINLTFANNGRYYNYEEFANKSVEVIQIKCPGQVLPTPDLLKRFYDIVKKFSNENLSQSSLIGVHCTHGLNRTGLFICKYMVDKMGFKPTDAIKQFETSRGHTMERKEYIEFISSEKYNRSNNVHSTNKNVSSPDRAYIANRDKEYNRNYNRDNDYHRRHNYNTSRCDYSYRSDSWNRSNPNSSSTSNYNFDNGRYNDTNRFKSNRNSYNHSRNMGTIQSYNNSEQYDHNELKSNRNGYVSSRNTRTYESRNDVSNINRMKSNSNNRPFQ